MLIGPVLVALAQVPQVALIGATLSAALWFGISRMRLSTRWHLLLGAFTGLATAVLTTVVLVGLLRLPPEIYRVPGIGTMRIMGAVTGIVGWPVVGAIVTTFYANTAPGPTSATGRGVWTMFWIAVGTVFAVILGTVMNMVAYGVLGSWADD